MSTWGQYEKAIEALIQCIRNKRIQAPGRPPFLAINHPPKLEASTRPTKNYFSSKNLRQFDSLPSDLLHNIFMCHASLVHRNKLKIFLVQLTQRHPVIFASTSYKLKYIPFDYFMHYDFIKYTWSER